MWTDEQIKIAKDLWENSQLTSAQIGDVIGFTKGAVIGKASRLSWKPRVAALFCFKRDITEEERLARIERNEQAKARRTAKRQEKLEDEKRREEIKKLRAKRLVFEPKRIHILYANETHCRDIVGEAKNGIICGNTVEVGKSYCSHHCRINFKPLEQASPRIRSFVEARR